MRTFYLRFSLYEIEIMAFQRDVSYNLLVLLVSLYRVFHGFGKAKFFDGGLA